MAPGSADSAGTEDHVAREVASNDGRHAVGAAHELDSRLAAKIDELNEQAAFLQTELDKLREHDAEVEARARAKDEELALAKTRRDEASRDVQELEAVFRRPRCQRLSGAAEVGGTESRTRVAER